MAIYKEHRMEKRTKALVSAFAAAAGVTALCMGGGLVAGAYGLAPALGLTTMVGTESTALAGLLGGFATAIGLRPGPGSGLAQKTFHAVRGHLDPPAAARPA
jgi:hypothetical protein